MAESTMDRPGGIVADRLAAPLFSRLWPSVAVYWLVTAAISLLIFLPRSTDYIGRDNDDVMRLVEVRDLLAGQNWFDLMQYRLGLAEGTLMHWSRLVDLPIAGLIKLFSLFLEPLQAEAVAATLWPFLLMPFLLFPLGLACRRLGGASAMHVGLGLGAIFIFTCVRFSPGALDHHNVQLVLAMWIAAMLVDPQKRVLSYGAAAFACALAMAIGAETVPLVAVACVIVALQWLWHGEAFARPARAFGLSLTLSISAFFFLTVPPRSYGMVTCDNLSFGFYTLSALGGTALFLVASLPRTPPRTGRLMLVAITGCLILLAAVLVAPACLGDPLGSLDPMLVELWLKAVSEARPFLTEMAAEPGVAGGFYAVGFFAIVICLCRSLRGEAVEIHIILAALVGVSWGVALVQVRGAFFANMLSILPLSLLIADLRQRAAARPKHIGLALGYIGTVLASVPIIWAFGGVIVINGWRDGFDVSALSQPGEPDASGAETGECGSAADMASLNKLDTGVVAAPSNSGADILRWTPHRVLSAPYHRNQKGMLTELHIGLAQPAEAEAFLRGAGVTIVAFCETDPQTRSLIRLKADGFYAGLARGAVPGYLQPVGEIRNGGFQFYRVLPAGD